MASVAGRGGNGAHEGLGALLAPRSVAVVGASRNPIAFGSLSIANLKRSGFGGRLFAVHPTEAQIDGVTCFRSIAELPEIPDLCVIALRAELVPDAVKDCAALGVGAVVVVGSGFAESGTPAGIAWQRSIAETARADGMLLLGPNTLGAAGFREGAVSAASANIPDDLAAGTVGIVSQSGGLGVTILATAARYGMGVHSFVAVGNEAGVTLADVIHHFVDQGLSAILCYFESIRDVAGFRAAARRAWALGVPIAIVKGGTQPSGQAVAAAHTASLAGSTRVLDTALAEWGVARVSSIEALVAAGVLFERFGPAPGDRCGVLGLGGGNAALLGDALELAGLSLASISEETAKEIRALLPDSNASNPLDAGGWFLGQKGHRLQQALDRFAADDGVDVLLYGMVPLAPARETVYVGDIAASAADSSKPGICLSGHAPETEFRRQQLARAGVVELPCTEAAMEALRMWLGAGHPTRGEPAPADESATTAPTLELAAWTSALGPGEQRTLLEDETVQLLRQVGIRFPDLGVADDADGAVRVAEGIGYPVVVKALAPGLAHRSQVGAVAVGLADADATARAARRVLANARGVVGDDVAVRLLVQRQADPGTEIIVGVQRDPIFGPVVVVGLGGVWSEVIDDVAFVLAPVTPESVGRALRRLRGARQLERLAKAGEFDESALVELVMGVGRVAASLGAGLESLDLNPVIVGAEGVSVVDALAVLRGGAP